MNLTKTWEIKIPAHSSVSIEGTKEGVDSQCTLRDFISDLGYPAETVYERETKVEEEEGAYIGKKGDLVSKVVVDPSFFQEELDCNFFSVQAHLENEDGEEKEITIRCGRSLTSGRSRFARGG